ncbi:hypothetical protein [Aquisalimonas asiatica]|uniref:Uncharacterized protein n=1 Tax=Aquisalimonas asiatica TaxID=406100 RepID=A0A1H8Q566_9GAMM|nr:hypothetical protein [Aquisalimonas asiatica]SEO49360.1 hypothetical protein SAMN04488052_101360 [Aquisalimonas asiatica]
MTPRPAGPMTLLVTLLLALATPGVVVSADPMAWHELEETADAGARHAGYWTAGWSAFHAANLGYSLYTASESGSADTRFDARINSVKSVLALGTLALEPPPHGAARERIADLAARRDSEPDALLQARYTLQISAMEERHRRRPGALAGPALVNVTAGSVIAFADDRPADGVRNAALGMLVSGIQLWTQPTTFSQAMHHRGDAAVTVGNTPLRFQYVTAVTPGYAAAAVLW